MSQPRTGFKRVDPKPESQSTIVDSGPTDEQLESMALALGLPYMPPSLRPPYWRESMLNLHGIVQQSILGNSEASLALEAILGLFQEERSGDA